MITSFGTSDYLNQYNKDPTQQQGDTEDRGVGTMLKDYAVDAAVQPALSIARTITTGGRMAAGPGGFWESADKALGGAQEEVKENWRSDRAKALDTVSPFGGEGTRSFWREPIAASIHAFLPSVPYLLAGIAAAPLGLAGEAAVTAAGGVFGGTEAIQQLRDFADRTPLKKDDKNPVGMEDLPVWGNYLREFNGDEAAAREKLFQDSLKPGTLAFNYFVNTLEVPAMMRGIRTRGSPAPSLRQRAGYGLQGAVVGGAQGALEGGTESLIEQQAKVQRGEQASIDYADIEKGAAQGSTFGGMNAALHAVAPPMREPSKAGIGPTMRATAVDTAELNVLDQQLNDRGGDPTALRRPGPRTGDQLNPYTGASLAGTMGEVGADQPQPGQGQNAPTPTAPPAPRFPNIETPRPGMPSEDDQGLGTGTPMPPAPGGRVFTPHPMDQAGEERAGLDISGDVTHQFKTAKGSVYNLFSDGTTIRNKAQRPEHGNDQGVKDRSQATFFITPDHANEMGGLFQAVSRFGKRIAQASNGQWGVQYTDGPSKGKFERRTMGKVSPTPEVGSLPVELWNNGTKVHFGNRVTEVTPVEQQTQTQTQTQTPFLKEREPEQMQLPLPGRILPPPWQTRETRPKPTPPLQLGPPAPTEQQRSEQALKSATAPVRIGKVKTGQERSFEARLRRYRGNAYGRTNDFYDSLKQQARKLDRVRSEAGLEPKNYEKKLGRRPEHPDIKRQQQREASERASAQRRQQRQNQRQAAREERSLIKRKERADYIAAVAKQEADRAAAQKAKDELAAKREAAVAKADTVILRFNRRMEEAAKKKDAPARAKAEAEARAEMVKAYVTEQTARMAGLRGAYTAEDRRLTRAGATRRDKLRRKWVPGKGYVPTEQMVEKIAKENKALESNKPPRVYRPVERPAAGPVDEGERYTEQFKARAYARQISARIMRGAKNRGDRIKRARWVSQLPSKDYDKLVSQFGEKPNHTIMSWEELVRWLHPQAEQQAREREAEGRPKYRKGSTEGGKPVKGSIATPPLGTVEEAVQTMQKGLQVARETERAKGYSQAKFAQRETEVGQALRKVLNRFGVKRMQQVFDTIYAKATYPRGKTGELTTNEKGELVEKVRRPDGAVVEVPFADTARGRFMQQKADQIAAMRKLAKFWNDAFPAMEKELQRRKKEMGLTDTRVPLRLARRVQVTELDPGALEPGATKPVPGKFRYQSGVERESNVLFNLTTDLQNFNEVVNYALDQIDKERKAGIDTPASLDEHLAQVRFMIGHIQASWQDYTAGDFKNLSERRRLRNQEVEATGNTISIQQLEAANQPIPAEEHEEGYTSDIVGPQTIGEKTPEVGKQMEEPYRGGEGVVAARIIPGSKVITQTAEEGRAQDIENRKAAEEGRAPKLLTGQELVDPDADASTVPRRTISGGSLASVTQNRNIVEEKTVADIAAQAEEDFKALTAAAEQGKAKTDEQLVGAVRAVRQEARYKVMRKQSVLKITTTGFRGKVRSSNLYTYDDRGIPTEGRVPAPSTDQTVTQQQRDVMDAHDQLKLPGEPQHHLIERVTTRDVLQRVRDHLAAGMPNFLPKYLNDRFLDRLERLLPDIPIYHAPYDAVSGFGEGGAGYYSPSHDRIYLSEDLRGDAYTRMAIHEMIHAALSHLLVNDHKFADMVNQLWQRARKAVADAKGEDYFNNTNQMIKDGLYGLTDPHEFLTETSSNELFRDFLDRLPPIRGMSSTPQKRSLMGQVYHAIQNVLRRFMGAFDGNTALDAFYYDQSTVLGRADAMVARGLQQVEQEGGRKPALAPGAGGGIPFGGTGPNYIRLAGVNAFMNDVLGNVKAGIDDRKDAARYAWNTIDKSRGIGIALHTLHDITQRGSQAFRELAAPVKEWVERRHAERDKILRTIDEPKLRRVENFLNTLNNEDAAKAQDLIIDESRINAYLDAPLDDQRNKHLHARQSAADKKAGIPSRFANTLRNHQIKEDYARLKPEFDAFIQKHPQFAEIRNMIHDWARERDGLIRRYRIQSLIKAADIVRPDAPQEAFDAAEVLTRDPAALTPAQGRLLVDNFVADPRSNTPEGKRVMREITKINEIDELKQHAGPYTPFMRRGQYAVSGTLKFPVPGNAIMLNPGSSNPLTGAGTGQPRYVFKTESEARDWIDQTSNKFGAKLLKAGEVYIDDRTNEPAMGDDPEDPDAQVRLRGKALQAAIDAGEPISKRYYVQFQHKLLSFHETERQAARARDEWLNHFGAANVDMHDVQDVEQFDSRQNVLYTTQQLRRMVQTARASDFYKHTLRTDAERGAFTDMINRSAEQYIHHRGVMQRYLPRGYVQGMSRDLLQNYSEWSQTTAGFLAKQKYDPPIESGMRELRRHVKERPYQQGDKNSLLDDRLYNELEFRLHSPKVNPRSNAVNRTVDRALRWTMLKMLPSAGYFAVQFTEPAMVGAPLMTDHHSVSQVIGTMAGMYRIAEASKFMREGWKDIKVALQRGQGRFDWMTLFSDQLASQPDAQRMTDLMQQAADRNYFDVTSSLEYDRAFKSSRNWVDRSADYLQGIFQSANTAIENLNRFVTLGTAYRLEFGKLTREGAENAHQQAVEYALNKAHEANGIYSNYNAPPVFGSTMLGRALFQFKKYPQRIIANYLRAASGAISAGIELATGKEVKQENIERARQLAMMLAVQGLMAGTLGLPTELFAIPLNAMYLAGMSPYNFDDAQRGYRTWLAKNLGQQGGEVAAHGLLRLTGTDIASRMSQSSLATFGNISSTKPADVQAALFTMISGAMGSAGMQTLQGIQKLGSAVSAYSAGSWTKGHDNLLDAGKNIIPLRAVVDLMEAVRKSTPEGMRTQGGLQMREPYGTGEAIVRGLGVTPAPEAESSEARRARDTAVKRYRAERKSLTDLWVQSSQSERASLWSGRISRFNDTVPQGQGITQSELLKARGVREKAERQPASNLGLPLDRRSRQFQDLNAAYNL